MHYGYFTAGNQPFDPAAIQSGAVASGDIGTGVILSGNVGSGAIIGAAGGGFRNVASGTLTTNDIGSGAIVSGHVASGQVGFRHLANGAVQSGSIASGTLDRLHQNSGTVIDYIACGQAISGVIAVAWGSGGCFIVPAERRSGLRLPAIGIVAGNFVSGDITPVVRRGIVGAATSGIIASGQPGKFLYVGSGGLLVNLSGFMGGASSGTGPNPVLNTGEISGSLVQRIGVSVSGGIDVFLDPFIASGLFSGLLGTY